MRQYVAGTSTEEMFYGSQVAACAMKEWPSEKLMMDIARENTFFEAAFAVKENAAFRLRWFTPGSEVDLRGHAVLAMSFVPSSVYEPEAEFITFHTTSSGDLFAGRPR